jgi:hypothetical protein
LKQNCEWNKANKDDKKIYFVWFNLFKINLSYSTLPQPNPA